MWLSIYLSTYLTSVSTLYLSFHCLPDIKFVCVLQFPFFYLLNLLTAEIWGLNLLWFLCYSKYNIFMPNSYPVIPSPFKYLKQYSFYFFLLAFFYERVLTTFNLRISLVIAQTPLCSRSLPCSSWCVCVCVCVCMRWQQTCSKFKQKQTGEWIY